MKIKKIFLISALAIELLFANCNNLQCIKSMQTSNYDTYRTPKLSNGFCKKLLMSFFLIGNSLSSTFDHCKIVGNNRIAVQESFHDHNIGMILSINYIKSLARTYIDKDTLESNDCFKKYKDRISKHLLDKEFKMAGIKDKEQLLKECNDSDFNNETYKECNEWATCMSLNPLYQKLDRVVTIEISNEKLNFTIFLKYGEDFKYDLNTLIEKKDILSFMDILSIQEMINCYINYIKTNIIEKRVPDEFYCDYCDDNICNILLKPQCHKRPRYP